MSDFKDFHKVENMHFNIAKLKKTLEEVIKIRNYDSANGIPNFAAICLNQIPGDPDSIKGHKARGIYWTKPNSTGKEEIRAKRINVESNNLHLSSENDLNGILTHIDRISPALVIIDSIQTILNPDLDSLPGSPSQIRDCGQKFLEVSKQKNVIIIIIGHVTKEGQLAGPRVLEHLVDVVLNFEGGPHNFAGPFCDVF